MDSKQKACKVSAILCIYFVFGIVNTFCDKICGLVKICLTDYAGNVCKMVPAGILSDVVMF